MNLNKSPGTTSKMVDRASQSLFIDVETCDAEREEKYDSDSNSEKCLTPVQKFDVSPVLDDDETSLEWDHMKGKKKDCSSPHSTASIESKYDEDAYANGCDEVNEEVWLVDKDTWDSSSDEDDECEGNKTEEGIAAPAAAPTHLCRLEGLDTFRSLLVDRMRNSATRSVFLYRCQIGNTPPENRMTRGARS